jgi:hypothetical protein
VTKYIVWSRHMPEETEPFDFEEVVRTDPKVAAQDAAIFREIFHRKAWVNEVESGRTKTNP